VGRQRSEIDLRFAGSQPAGACDRSGGCALHLDNVVCRGDLHAINLHGSLFEKWQVGINADLLALIDIKIQTIVAGGLRSELIHFRQTAT
jgi:hypothetical protein